MYSSAMTRHKWELERFKKDAEAMNAWRKDLEKRCREIEAKKAARSH